LGSFDGFQNEGRFVLLEERGEDVEGLSRCF